MTGVEREHGVDFSAGIPAACAVLGALLDTVIEGVAPDFALVKLEGDAVFAAAREPSRPAITPARPVTGRPRARRGVP